MKIIKKGTGAKQWSIKQKCTGAGNGNGGCGAQLLVEKSDLYKTYSSHYDGSTDVYITFTCPECHCETDVPEHLVSVAYIPDKKEWQKNQKSD